MYPGASLSVRSGNYGSNDCAYLNSLKDASIVGNGVGFASLFIKK